MADRREGRTLSQSLLVWRGAKLVRKYYGIDLTIERRGALSFARPFRIPRVAALALPGSAADAPRHLVIAAAAYGDTLSLRLSFDDFAQVVFPNDRFPGMTALSESPGRARISGRIGDTAIDFEARAQAEFNHAA
jgi:hypothetical protein